MFGSAAEREGPLHFRRGPSCFWIFSAPLFFSYCLSFVGLLTAALVYGLLWIGPGPYSTAIIVALSCAGAVLLVSLFVGFRLLYRWGKTFRVWSVTFDAVEQMITARWGLFVPFRVREFPFAEVEAMHVVRKAVRGTRLVYPVSLVLADAIQVPLLEYNDYLPARRTAEEAAAFASRPLIDATVQPPQFIAADKVGKPMRAAGPPVGVKTPVAAPPHGCRCSISWEKETVVICVPPRSFRLVTIQNVKIGVVLALIAAAAGGGAWWHTGDTRKSAAAALLTLLVFCLPLALLFLAKRLLMTRRTTTIRVDEEGLHYRARGLLYRATRRIPHEELRTIRLNENAIEILTARERLRFGEHLNAPEREWLCAALNQLVTG